MIYKLIYTSKAAPGTTDATLEDILASAQRNNSQADITGVLLFFDNSFIQLLEGRRSDVMAMYDKIMDDPRHTDVDLMFEEYQEDRVFGDWRMAYVPRDRENARKLCGNMDVTSVDQMADILRHPGRILQQFFKGMMGEMARAAKSATC